MAFYLLDDRFADDPLWDVLSRGRPTILDALQAGYLRLCSKAAHQRSDGYLTRQMAERYVTPHVLKLLTTPVLGRQPRLHQPGDTCECLGDQPWIAGYAYRIHHFLRRNPSRSEIDRNRAQKADLRDARLKALVHARDGGCCRYCRSGPLHPKSGRNKDRRKVLQFDHVDPDRAASPDGEGLVVACARCNEHKGHRLPAEADLVLLPAPTDAERAAWAARGQAVFDLPTPVTHAPDRIPDQSPITDGSATDHQPTTDPVTDQTNGPASDQNPGRHPDRTQQSSGQPHPDQADQPPDQAPHQPPGGGGLGRGGQPDPDSPDPGRPPTRQPARTPAAPDIYTRRSRSPAAHHGPRPPARHPTGHHPCPVCGQPLDPAAGATHPACDEIAGWPPGTTPTPPHPPGGSP